MVVQEEEQDVTALAALLGEKATSAAMVTPLSLYLYSIDGGLGICRCALGTGAFRRVPLG